MEEEVLAQPTSECEFIEVLGKEGYEQPLHVGQLVDMGGVLEDF